MFGHNRNAIILAIIVVGLLGVFSFNNMPSAKATFANDTLVGYAWSDNIGWISMNNCPDSSNCVSNNSYQVTKLSSGDLSGFGWSDNIGWVSFNAVDTAGCGSVAHVSVDGIFTGWAKALAGDVASGWDGCISLGSYGMTGYGLRVNMENGNFLGIPRLAWGDDVMGWIDFSGVNLIIPTIPVLDLPASGTNGGTSDCTNPYATAHMTGHVNVNGHVSPLTAHFEYLTETAYNNNISNGNPHFYGAIITIPELSLPADGSGNVSKDLNSLPVNTTYKYIMVATDGNGIQFPSEEKSFTTPATCAKSIIIATNYCSGTQGGLTLVSSNNINPTAICTGSPSTPWTTIPTNGATADVANGTYTITCDSTASNTVLVSCVTPTDILDLTDGNCYISDPTIGILNWTRQGAVPDSCTIDGASVNLPAGENSGSFSPVSTNVVHTLTCGTFSDSYTISNNPNSCITGPKKKTHWWEF